MRVTSRSLVDSVVNNLQKSQQTLDKLQTQISSNKRLHRPSDDPAAVWRSLRSRQDHASHVQHARNMDDAGNWLVSSGRALDGTQQILAKMRELAVQASDDSYSANDRAAIGREITQLKQQVLSLFNGTQYVGQSLFSGRQTGVAPFSADASGNVTYAGETGVTVPAASIDVAAVNGIESLTLTDAASAEPGTYRMGMAALAPGATSVDVTLTRYDSAGVAVPGATQTVAVAIPAAGDLTVVDFSALGITVTANTALGTATFAETATSEFTVGDATIEREIGAGVKLPVNLLGSKFLTMFQDLRDLERALSGSIQPEISKGIANLDKAIELTLVSQAELGTRQNRLDNAGERLLEADSEAVRIQREIEDVDLADALTRLTTQQAIYRAALETGARVVPMSILDFLR